MRHDSSSELYGRVQLVLSVLDPHRCVGTIPPAMALHAGLAAQPRRVQWAADVPRDQAA